ncbi:MAG: hypothetical protein GX639_05700 [Fibrobacter sp.]|nr:hypothetical protein [Fibrobacter sp.]
MQNIFLTTEIKIPCFSYTILLLIRRKNRDIYPYSALVTNAARNTGTRLLFAKNQYMKPALKIKCLLPIGILFNLFKNVFIHFILSILLLAISISPEETKKSEIQFNHRLRNRYVTEKDTIKDPLNLSLKNIETDSTPKTPNLVLPRIMLIGGYSLFACGISAAIISYKKMNEIDEGPFSYSGTIKNEEKNNANFSLFFFSCHMVGGGLFSGIFGTVKTIRAKYRFTMPKRSISLILNENIVGLNFNYCF